METQDVLVFGIILIILLLISSLTLIEYSETDYEKCLDEIYSHSDKLKIMEHCAEVHLNNNCSIKPQEGGE